MPVRNSSMTWTTWDYEMKPLNREMIESHVRQANAMWVHSIDNVNVIINIHAMALEANPRRATPFYISLVMTDKDYLGKNDGLNSAPHVKNILNREDIFCGKFDAPLKVVSYYENSECIHQTARLSGRFV